VKISHNASFSRWLFVFVHVPPIFSVLLTYLLKINSLFFELPGGMQNTLTCDAGLYAVARCSAGYSNPLSV